MFQKTTRTYKHLSMVFAAILCLLLVQRSESQKSVSQEATRVKRYFHNDMVQVSRTCVVYDETGPGGTLVDDLTGTACTLIAVNQLEPQENGVTVTAKLIQVSNPIVDYFSIDDKNFSVITTHVIDREKLCQDVVKAEIPVTSDNLFQCCVNHKRDCDLPVTALVQIHLPKQVASLTDSTGQVDTQSSFMHLVLRLIDINDNPPRFIQAVHTLVVSEGVQMGTKLLLPSAEDLDSDDYGIIRYQLQSTEDSTFELVHSSTASFQSFGYHDGNNLIPGGHDSRYYYAPLSEVDASLLSARLSQIYLKVIRPLDWETKREYSLVLLAKDNGSPALTGQLEIKVLVTDENDNHPVFLNKTFTIHVPENYSTGKRLLQLKASDPDEGSAGRVEYSLVLGIQQSAFQNQELTNRLAGNHRTQVYLQNTSLPGPKELFHIDKRTGWLSMNGPLDYEKVRHHVVRVLARDEGGHPGFDEATVHILVTDVNDVPPAISVATVLEGQNRFNASTVNSLGLYVTETPDYVISETARSGLPGLEYRRSSGVDSMLLAFVAVSDPDTEEGGQFQCSLFPVDGPREVTNALQTSQFSYPHDSKNSVKTLAISHVNRFRLNPISNSQFELLHLGKFDRETSATETVQIICFDLGLPRLTASYTVSVHVIDVNDKTPKFSRSHYQFSVKENQPIDTRVEKVTAIDDDSGQNGEVEYFLDDAGKEFFSMDAVDGTLYSKAVFDREVKQSYRFQVYARDQGKPHRLTGTAMVNITVADTNDHVPEFIGLDGGDGGYSFRIAENEPPNSHVGLLLGTDKDSDLNGQLRYRLITSSPFFHIDSATGEITTLTPLDRERQAEYNLIVVAIDKGHPPQSATVKLNILVTDVNDNDPNVVFPVNGRGNVSVSFREPPGEVIARIEARDPDEGQNAQLHYTIVTGNRNSVFRLGGTSAELMIDRDLQVVDIGSYLLTIIIQDGGLPTRSTQVLLVVDVLDTPARLYPHRYTGTAHEEYIPSESYESKHPQFTRSGQRTDTKLTHNLESNNNDNIIGTGAILVAIVALSCAIILVLLGITAYLCGRRVIRQVHRCGRTRDHVLSTVKPGLGAISITSAGKSVNSFPTNYNDPILLDPSNGTLLRCQIGSLTPTSNSNEITTEDQQKVVCLASTPQFDGYFTCLPKSQGEDQTPFAYEIIQNQPHVIVSSSGSHRCCKPNYYTLAAHGSDWVNSQDTALSLTELHKTLPTDNLNGHRFTTCPYRNSYTPRSLKWNMAVKHHPLEDDNGDRCAFAPYKNNERLYRTALNTCDSPLSEHSGTVRNLDGHTVKSKLRTAKSWETFSSKDVNSCTAQAGKQSHTFHRTDELAGCHEGNVDEHGFKVHARNLEDVPGTRGAHMLSNLESRRIQTDSSHVSTFLPQFVTSPTLGTVFKEPVPASYQCSSFTSPNELWKSPSPSKQKEKHCDIRRLPHIFIQPHLDREMTAEERNKKLRSRQGQLMDTSLQSGNLIDLLEADNDMQSGPITESTNYVNGLPCVIGVTSEFV